MNKFQVIYQRLLNKDPSTKVLVIDGVPKEIKAMVRLTSRNYLAEDGEYIKIIFTDGSFLLAIEGEGEFYYADSVIGHIQEISDEIIGKTEIINYKGKEYKLENADDYQYVLELLAGAPQDIEGECRFSDYAPTKGTKEILSLGWLSETGKRADIHPILIDIDRVNLPD